LEEDDDDVNETMNSTKFSNGNSYHNHSNSNQYQQQPFPLRDGETHLKNMLDSKKREIDYVTSQLTAERKQNKSVVDEYEKRLAIAEAEKERALMNRNQTHELLVENKGRSIELEDGNEKLRSKIRSLETENSNLVGELESTKLMLSDVQIKYNMVEKNVMFNADRNTDNILKQAQERHSAQIAMMQQQVDGLKSKFDDLEHDHKNLEIRYKELQRSRESMLIEKSEIINHLNKNLEDAQRQCQDLLSRPNLSQENRQLQNIVRSVESQKEEMNRTINKLQKRLQEQTSEMELMDSIVQECGGNNISFSESTKFIHRDPLKNVNASTPVTSEARLARVKEELCKSLNNIKNKREEIKICEIQLQEKDEEIKQLKSDENKALVQMNHYRDETIRLESKTKILEKEVEKKRQELSQKIASCPTDEKYEEKIQILLKQKQTLEKELNSIKSDYERLTMKNGELVEKENQWAEKVHVLESELKSPQDASKVLEDLQREREKNRQLEEDLKKLKVDQENGDEGELEIK
jgi:centrosomal protein CEP152